MIAKIPLGLGNNWPTRGPTRLYSDGLTIMSVYHLVFCKVNVFRVVVAVYFFLKLCVRAWGRDRE